MYAGFSVNFHYKTFLAIATPFFHKNPNLYLWCGYCVRLWLEGPSSS